MRTYVCNQRLKGKKGNYSPLLQGRKWEKKLAKHFIEMWRFSRPSSSVHMKIPGRRVRKVVLCWLAAPHIMIFFCMCTYVCDQRLKASTKKWDKKLAKHFIEMWKFSRPNSVHMKIPPMMCFTCSLRKKDWFIYWYDMMAKCHCHKIQSIWSLLIELIEKYLDLGVLFSTNAFLSISMTVKPGQ